MTCLCNLQKSRPTNGQWGHLSVGGKTISAPKTLPSITHLLCSTLRASWFYASPSLLNTEQQNGHMFDNTNDLATCPKSTKRSMMPSGGCSILKFSSTSRPVHVHNWTPDDGTRFLARQANILFGVSTRSAQRCATQQESPLPGGGMQTFLVMCLEIVKSNDMNICSGQ